VSRSIGMSGNTSPLAGECCRIGDGRSLSPFRTIFAKQEGGARQEEGDSKPQWSVAQC
jgi:hypothetical protein